MSGGHFYNLSRYQLEDVADSIEFILNKSGKLKTKADLKDEFRSKEWYEKYPEDMYHFKYSDEVIEKLKESAELFRKAAVYLHCVDYLICGDYGEESFLRALDKKLNKL